MIFVKFKAIRHFCTITKHRHLVICNCFKAGIFWQGLLHDLSKYSPTEFAEGVKFYAGTKSPTEGARRELGFSRAWVHHQGRNKHHFEYWRDYNPVTHTYEAVKMPLKYVKEMFCDRVAAGKVYLGKNYTDDNPIQYFQKGIAKTLMHPETAELLEGWLFRLQREGEKATFKYIKSLKEEKK